MSHGNGGCISGQQQTFDAVLTHSTDGLGWTVVHVPFRPSEVFREMVRLRVKGTIQGAAFRSSLFPCKGRPEQYVLLVNRATQRSAGIAPGSVATVVLEPDLDPRPAELPEELDALLDDEPGLRLWYQSLSEYTRREIGKWVLSVRSDDARMRRAQQMAERLFSTMEAERELPPAIARALAARPKARAGWNSMTPTQRRMELFAVNYYRSPDSQTSRILKLCAAAEKKAPQ